MRVKPAGLVSFLATLAIAGAALAQYGHPLKGSWSGDWGTSRDDRHRVLLELHWDGTAITGTINPGPDGVPLKAVTLDPAKWTVKLEADGKSGQGGPVRYVIEGKLENLELPNRSINGTWSSNKGRGTFTASRQ